MMYCPKCGRKCGADDRFCLACGAALPPVSPEKRNTQKGAVQIPTSGGYLGVGGSVVLSDSAVSICVKSLFKKYRTWIPYNQLVTVIYARPTYRPKAYGALLLRGEINKNVPIPKNKGLFADKSAIAIDLNQDTLFYHIYYMLKAVAPPSAQFEMIIPETNISESDGIGIDVNDFFDRYAPFRERAAEGIHAKYEIPQETARMLVNRVFDARQKIIYEKDPLDAIRDLNLVVADMRRREQRANRDEADRRKRQELDSVKSSLENVERMKVIEMLDKQKGKQ